VYDGLRNCAQLRALIFERGGEMLEIHEVYPYLRVHNSAEAIDFYTRAFDAKGTVSPD
jgi:hypothetical protein